MLDHFIRIFQIITGSAGNKEGREEFVKKIPVWSAFHSRVIITLKLILFFVLKIILE